MEKLIEASHGSKFLWHQFFRGSDQNETFSSNTCCLWLMKSLEDQVMGELDLTSYKMKRIQLMLLPWKCAELGELAAEVENN